MWWHVLIWKKNKGWEVSHLRFSIVMSLWNCFWHLENSSIFGQNCEHADCLFKSDVGFYPEWQVFSYVCPSFCFFISDPLFFLIVTQLFYLWSNLFYSDHFFVISFLYSWNWHHRSRRRQQKTFKGLERGTLGGSRFPSIQWTDLDF